LERKIYWYISKSGSELSLLFSPRMTGNKWVIKEGLFDEPILKIKEFEISIENKDIIVEKTWELIADVLGDLSEEESQILDYLIHNKIKVIVYLTRAGFNQNQLFQLARIIEDHDFQDFIIPRTKIT